MNNYLPRGYHVPKSSGNYYKFEAGQNRFRVMSAPIFGWLYWSKDDKPVRLRDNVLPKTPEDIRRDEEGKAERLRHFWAIAVWSYKESKLQILEITQTSIQTQMEELFGSEDWGNPMDYDLTVTKKGEKLLTEYTVQPSPVKPLTPEQLKAKTGMNINLEALYEGGDPFAAVEVPEGIEPPAGSDDAGVDESLVMDEGPSL